MTKKAKVIEGLECCILPSRGLEDCKMNGCPYIEDAERTGEGENLRCQTLLFADALSLMAEKRQQDIRGIAGLWCDDITFCQEDCDLMDCPRNQKNIRDRTVPHSFSVETPTDCPKRFIVWRKGK